MSQNKQKERDRAHVLSDYETNVTAKLEIEELTRKLEFIESEKINKII
jgi:uncharacterized membrane protein